MSSSEETVTVGDEVVRHKITEKKTECLRIRTDLKEQSRVLLKVWGLYNPVFFFFL